MGKRKDSSSSEELDAVISSSSSSASRSSSSAPRNDEEVAPATTEKAKASSSFKIYPTALPLTLLILQVIIIVLFFFGDYVETPSAVPHNMFMDVQVMIYVGFGFLMVFLHKYSFSSVGMTFLLASVAAEVYLITLAIVQMVAKDDGWKGLISGSIDNLTRASFAAGSVLITFGFVLGTFSPLQMIITCICEVILYTINEELGLLFGALDAGGSMTIHMFGAYFGVALSITAYFSHGKKRRQHQDNAARRSSDLMAMIGTLFLWLFWPSFNAAIATANGKERAVVNTVISLLGSCVTSFAISHLLKGRLSMPDIQNATLAGGVAMGAAAEMAVTAGGAVLIGSFAGMVSVVGYTYISPFLERTFGLHDTCGAHNLHGMPSLIGGIASIFAALAGDNGKYAVNGLNSTTHYNEMFVKVSEGRSASDQALFQLAFIGTTLGISLIGGMLTSFLVTNFVDNVDHMFADEELWQGEVEEEDVQGHMGAAALTAKLCAAAGAGELPLCERLVLAGASPTGQDYDGRTPMHYAAAEGRLPILLWLHQVHHVSITEPQTDHAGRSPLADAIDARRGVAVTFLRENGAVLSEKEKAHFVGELINAAADDVVAEVDRLLGSGITVDSADYDGRTPLMVAAAEGHLGVVRLLIAKGADPLVKDRWNNDAIQSAAQGSQPKIAKELRRGLSKHQAKDAPSEASLMKDADNARARGVKVQKLNDAAAAGDLSKLQSLAEKGDASPGAADFDGRSPLHVAAAEGHLQIVKYLAGLKEVNINATDRDGQTPLRDAILSGHAHVAAWLRRHGGIVANRKQGYQVCDMAFRGDVEGLRKLADSGIEIQNVGDYDGRTALHLAAAQNQIAAAEYLISLGAVLKPKDRFGGTPLAEAREHGHKKIVALLRAAMKKQDALSGDEADSDDDEAPKPAKKAVKKNSSKKL